MVIEGGVGLGLFSTYRGVGSIYGGVRNVRIYGR